MSTKKRIQIPRDLKRGDSIVDNHGVKRDFLRYDNWGGIIVRKGIFTENGYRFFDDVGYAVKIIRAETVKSKAKKPKALKVCPIPKDAKKGDTVVLRNSHRRVVARNDDVGVCLVGICPSFLPLSGKSALEREWDCVEFIRAQPVVKTPNPKKPKTDPDAEYLLSIIEPHINPSDARRIRKIAKRLESLK